MEGDSGSSAGSSVTCSRSISSLGIDKTADCDDVITYDTGLLLSACFSDISSLVNLPNVITLSDLSIKESLFSGILITGSLPTKEVTAVIITLTSPASN